MNLPRMPRQARWSRGRSRDRRGVALVITLAFLVLATFVVVAFLSKALSSRKIEDVSGKIVETDLLARSALEAVVGDLRAEMRAGSTLHSSNGVTVLQPAAPDAMLPRRVLAASVSGTNFASLVKQSVGRFFPNSAPTDQNSVTPIIQAATGISTDTASANGRVVTGARWTTPRLLFGGTNVAFANNQTPQWVLVTRAGIPSTQGWNNAFRDATQSNQNFVIGRFAFNIYEVGGLLDANVAGYANIVPGIDLGRKGSLGLAALGGIPGVTDAARFVTNWRNKASGSSPANYLAYLGLSSDQTNEFFNKGPSTGFLKPAASLSGTAADSMLVGRQDLINLALAGDKGITPQALPYLTHFTRALNAPSWSPSTPSGSSIDYAALANTGTATNRFLPNVRVAASFTRQTDGTTAQRGEPLLKTRFPLSRLAGIGRNGVNATGNTTMVGGTLAPANAATIQRDFGLVWSSDRWNYAGHTGSSSQSTIKTLDQVAAENREPNFFELLQAAMLNGSLGRDLPAAHLLNSQVFDLNRPGQIVQIGANLIDQYDADSYPTKVNFGGNDYTGTENIPYLSRVFTYAYRASSDPNNLRAYLCFEFWNPHRPKANTDAPTRFRVAAEGRFSVFVGSLENASVAPAVYGYPGFMPPDTPPDKRNTDTKPGGPLNLPNGLRNNLGPRHRLTDTGQPEFTATASATWNAGGAYHTPTLLTQYDGATAGGNNSMQDGTVQFVGLYAGAVRSSANTYGNYNSTPWNPCYGGYIEERGSVFLYVQYWNGSAWVTYQQPTPIIRGMWDGAFNKGVGSTTSPGLFLQGADPRSLRFGYGTYHTFDYSATPPWKDTTYVNSIGRTMRPDSTQTTDARWPSYPYGSYLGTFSAHPGWSPLGPAPYGNTVHRFGWLAENKDNRPTWYRDKDNVLRHGDAAYAPNLSPVGQPLEQISPDNGAYRPIMLDRPFRSVGEMGYAFRDLPFKSLDFFTANSADSALLDVFCVSESPVSGVTAGVLNLNTGQKDVLKAVLTAALKDELNASSTLSATDADAIAAAMLDVTVTGTGATPLLNRGELATRVSPALQPANFGGNPADSAIKARRESMVRALADVGNTRTWNLMIDLVAQSGLYGVAAASLDKFIVEGERRYWLHLAIDRYTGRVIARNLEPVNE